MNLTSNDVLTLAFTSGVVAGVTNQGLAWAREAVQRRHSASEQDRERKHQEQLQADERQHQRLLRREAAHSNAKPVYLPCAEQIHDWVQYEWGERWGGDVDYVGIHMVRPILTRPEEVIAAARKIATGHPTADVRSQASTLEGQIDGEFNMINGATVGEPTENDFRRWSQLVDQLITALHDPA